MEKISKKKQSYLFSRGFTLLAEKNSYKRNDIEIDIESIKDMQFERFKEYVFNKLKDTPTKRINLSPTERNGSPFDKKRYKKKYTDQQVWRLKHRLHGSFGTKDNK